MSTRVLMLAAVALCCAGLAHAAPRVSVSAPLTIGETFTIQSRVLGETRRINVYRAPLWSDTSAAPRPVLYMPDGGLGEDFLHVAGLLEVSIGNETMRPFLLVGIENTQRRRDLTGPTTDPEDRKIAKVVGGSAAFRAFLRDELMPVIESRYRTTGERALMGESLAGLFTVETFLLEPDLFDTYIAFDPSLWWNHDTLVTHAFPAARAAGRRPLSLWIASSSQKEIAAWSARFAERVATERPVFGFRYEPMPAETHATIYHPAAVHAVRALFAPPSDSTRH